MRSNLSASPSSIRRMLMWLVAGVLALQGLSVGISNARGAARTHREARSALVLSDFRRDGNAAERQAPAEEGWLGHHHGTARHFHAATDGTVLLSAPDAALDTAAQDNGHALDLAAAAFIAVVAALLLWSASGVSHRRASHAPWQPSTGAVRRLERPPQSA
jgi:hypothetical protein